MEARVTIQAIIFAAVAGLIGAGIWAGIAYGAHMEIGWIAWGIGGLVGFAMTMGGGRGAMAAVVGVGITILSICGGKIWGVSLSVDKEITAMMEKHINQAAYDRVKQEAEDFAKLTGESGYPKFMMENGYTEAESEAEVTKEELADFKEMDVPKLRGFKAQGMTFETWKAESMARILPVFRSQIGFGDMLESSLGLMDILFFGLGVATCFKVIAGADTYREQ